ncbi:hypothetical protein FBU30_001647, partial [Linnemannia zychae]
DLVLDPNMDMSKLLTHIESLKAQATQVNIENAHLHAQMEAQAYALQDSANGPLLSISTTLEAI